jgi:hypothetical protein
LAADREIVVPFSIPREAISPATEYFGRGVTTSLAILRERGYYEGYLQLVSPRHRADILAAKPTEWLPIELALEHYLACDRLELDHAEDVALGERAAVLMYAPAFMVTAKIAASAGATPWTVIQKLGVTVTKSLRGGGGVCAYKLGPKEARIEFEGHPLAASKHLRAAMTGALRHPLSFFCKKVVARALLTERANTMAYLVSWV